MTLETLFLIENFLFYLYFFLNLFAVYNVVITVFFKDLKVKIIACIYVKKIYFYGLSEMHAARKEKWVWHQISFLGVHRLLITDGSDTHPGPGSRKPVFLPWNKETYFCRDFPPSILIIQHIQTRALFLLLSKVFEMHSCGCMYY